MNCPNIADSIANHFEQMLSPAARQIHERHLAECRECRDEIAALNAVPQLLSAWQTQPVPEWNRNAIVRPHATRKSLPQRRSHWSSIARWTPLAASMVLAVAVFAQTRLEVTDTGWSIAFGGDSELYSDEQLERYISGLAASQQAETRQWVEATLRAYGETTADNVYQWMTWMEQQRAADVQRMEAGFSQLLDRDFQTVDSVRQLASYVMYQETP